MATLTITIVGNMAMDWIGDIPLKAAFPGMQEKSGIEDTA